MKPDYETLLKGGTTWRAKHNGIYLSLAFHGYSEGTNYSHPGIWCYYLHLTEQMFYPEDWKKLWLPETMTEWGPSHESWNFPDCDFHGGVTFYEKGRMWDKHLGRQVGTIKVGCDYAHLWDRDEGYPHTYEWVLRDAKHSAEVFMKMFPNRRTCCDYSGIWGEPDEFYTAANGTMVHKSHEARPREDGWTGWLPTNDGDVK